MGKYTGLKGKWPRFVDPQPGQQERIELTKQEILGMVDRDASPETMLARLAEGYAGLRQAKDDLTEKLRAVQLRLDAYSQLLVDHLEAASLTSAVVAKVGRLGLRDEPYSSVRDRQATLAWAQAEAPELLSVQWQSLNALVKERLLAGEAPPPGVEVFVKTSVALTAEK